MNEDEIKAALRELAAANAHPWAPRFGATVRDHLAPFDALRIRGVPWRTIATICAEEGIAGQGGKPLDPRVLAAQIHRARSIHDKHSERPSGHSDHTVRTVASAPATKLSSPFTAPTARKRASADDDDAASRREALLAAVESLGQES